MSELKNMNDGQNVSMLQKLVKDIRVCMFSTDLSNGGTHTRPMSTQDIDDKGDLWFFSSDSSNKNIEIWDDASTELYFSHPDKEEYLYIKGKSDIIKDRSEIEKKWSLKKNSWASDKNDPNLCLIRVHPEHAYYWDSQNGKGSELINDISGNKRNNGQQGNPSIH